MSARIPLPAPILEQLVEKAVSEAPSKRIDHYRLAVIRSIVLGNKMRGAKRYLVPKDAIIEAAVRSAMAKMPTRTSSQSDIRENTMREKLALLADSIVGSGKGKTLFQLRLDMVAAMKRDWKGERPGGHRVFDFLLAALARQKQTAVNVAPAPGGKVAGQTSQSISRFVELRQLTEQLLVRLSLPQTPELEATETKRCIRDYLSDLARVAVNPVQKSAVERLVKEFEVRERHGPEPFHSGYVQSVHWNILEPSGESWATIVGHYERLSRDHEEELDLERLRVIYGFGPDEIFIGRESFEGYVVFCFASSNIAVLECPRVGNALYLMKRGEWKSLSQLSKSELLVGDRVGVSRIVHSRYWKAELEKVFRPQAPNK